MTHQGLIIESKHVIYFNYNGFEHAARSSCNMLFLKVRLHLK